MVGFYATSILFDFEYNQMQKNQRVMVAVAAVTLVTSMAEATNMTSIDHPRHWTTGDVSTINIYFMFFFCNQN